MKSGIKLYRKKKTVEPSLIDKIVEDSDKLYDFYIKFTQGEIRGASGYFYEGFNLKGARRQIRQFIHEKYAIRKALHRLKK